MASMTSRRTRAAPCSCATICDACGTSLHKRADGVDRLVRKTIRRSYAHYAMASESFNLPRTIRRSRTTRENAAHPFDHPTPSITCRRSQPRSRTGIEPKTIWPDRPASAHQPFRRTRAAAVRDACCRAARSGEDQRHRLDVKPQRTSRSPKRRSVRYASHFMSTGRYIRWTSRAAKALSRKSNIASRSPRPAQTSAIA